MTCHIDKDFVLGMAERVRTRDKRVSALRNHITQLHKFILALSERVAAQSELLSRRTEHDHAE